MHIRTPEIILAAAYGINLFGDREKVSEFALLGDFPPMLLVQIGKDIIKKQPIVDGNVLDHILKGQWSILPVKTVDILKAYLPPQIELALRYAVDLTVDSFIYYMKMLPKPVPNKYRRNFAEILLKAQLEVRERMSDGQAVEKHEIIELIKKPNINGYKN